MTQFYVSIIFIGIFLVVFSIVLIVYDRKKSSDGTERLEEKKKQLEDIITDAEEMVEELNKFSDYIVSQMDLKNKEMEARLRQYDAQIAQMERRISTGLTKAQQSQDTRQDCTQKAVNRKEVEASVKQEKPMNNYNSDLVIEHMPLEQEEIPVVQHEKAGIKQSEKVIPLNSRHREILQMASNGLSTTEIAKRLKMGKGEIQLILQLNKQI